MIDMCEFLKLSNINVIDLRSADRYDINHIPGSINIPYESLIIDPFKFLSKNSKYYLYCESGVTSKSVCNILSKIGFDVVNINGGFKKWLLSKEY